MEITHELKLDVTIIDCDAQSGDLPLKATDERDLEEKLKKAFDVDDLHINDLKSFENWQEA